MKSPTHKSKLTLAWPTSYGCSCLTYFDSLFYHCTGDCIFKTDLWLGLVPLPQILFLVMKSTISVTQYMYWLLPVAVIQHHSQKELEDYILAHSFRGRVHHGGKRFGSRWLGQEAEATSSPQKAKRANRKWIVHYFFPRYITKKIRIAQIFKGCRYAFQT